MRYLLLLVLFIFFNCSSVKKNKSTSKKDIDIDYIREISNYSNFKKLINRGLDCKTSKSIILPGISTGNEQFVTKCHNKKTKELVFIDFKLQSDIYENHKYYYKNNALVLINSETSINKKDTVINRIFGKDNSIYHNSNPTKKSPYLLNKGIKYLKNFSL